MKLLQIAYEERLKQLKRKQASEKNEMIKEIIETEIKSLNTEWEQTKQKQK